MPFRLRVFDTQGRFVLWQVRALAIALTLHCCVLLPVIAQTAAPSQQAPSADIFGEEVTLAAKTIVFITGKATWDNAFPTLKNNFKTLAGFLGQQKLQSAGPPMTIFTGVNNTGFQYQAAVPIAVAPANFPRGNVVLGQSPAGKALKFVHRGPYDAMDLLYEAITNYLDEHKIEREGLFLEEYVTDPVTTPEDQLVVNVFVLVK